MNRFYQGNWIDSMASRFIEELPEKYLEKNSFFDDSKNDDNDFEFNQDFEINDGKRSPGWEEGLFPHQKSIEEKGQNGLEEERRLAYVGITRAKKKALISFAMNRFYQGNWIDSMASRFIDELPEKYLEKNSFFDESKDDDNDFEFNQDFEIDEQKKSPGWIRYQKRIK